MSYSDFKTLEQAIAAFDLTIKNNYHLFATIQLVEPSQWLQDPLSNTVDLASTISTKKARSELITPILLEVGALFLGSVGYFSRNTFNVDEIEQGK